MTGRGWRSLAFGVLSLFAALGVSATAVEAQTVSIQGMLVGEAGQPLSGVTVFAEDPTVGQFGFQAFSGTHSDGTFSFAVAAAPGGSCGGRCLSMGDYVTGPGATTGANGAGAC